MSIAQNKDQMLSLLWTEKKKGGEGGIQNRVALVGKQCLSTTSRIEFFRNFSERKTVLNLALSFYAVFQNYPGFSPSNTFYATPCRHIIHIHFYVPWTRWDTYNTALLLLQALNSKMYWSMAEWHYTRIYPQPNTLFCAQEQSASEECGKYKGK